VGILTGIPVAGGLTLWVLFTSINRIRDSANRTIAENNFRQISMAMESHAVFDQDNFFVEQAGAVPPNAVKHSWRVLLLPYLDQESLYRQIHLNEPWDSPWNRHFHTRMPSCFEFPGRPAPRGMTFIQVVHGRGTAFPGGGKKMRFPADFQDGTTQTVILVEAARAVNWMQPEDINIEEVHGPLLDRLGRHPGAAGPMVGMADDSVRFLKPGLTEKTLRAALTPAGNEILGNDW
jgi:hypothetical protein